MTDDLLELDSLLADIADMLGRAERMAGEISGEEGGRDPIDVTVQEPCPDCESAGTRREYWNYEGPGFPPDCPTCGGKGGIPVRYTEPGQPAVEGWPAMIKLANALNAMAETLRAARSGEVDDAIRVAHDEARDAPEPIAPGDERYYERRR